MGSYSYRYQPSGFGFGMTMTPGVKALLILNVGIFVLVNFLRINIERWFFLGLTPQLVVHGMVWQVFTYMFLHGSVGHILFNMLSLWMFGTVLEQTWGMRHFLRFYTVCGVGAGLTVVAAAYLFGGTSDRIGITIGASGAIYGLLLAFGWLFPDATILAFFFFPMPARYFVWIMGAVSFFMVGTESGGSVSHIAHLGGLLVGPNYMRMGRTTYSYSRRRSRLSTLLSMEEWRMAYDRWRRRRLRKKFEVYMRKQDGGDRWVQ